MGFTDLKKGVPDWHEKYNEDFRAFETQLSNKANKQKDITWFEVQLLDGFEGYPENVPKYAMDEQGHVWLRGALIPNNMDSFMQTNFGRLPKGYYCPGSYPLFVHLTSGITSADAVVLGIDSGGGLFVYTPRQTTGIKGTISLGMICIPYVGLQ